MTRSEKPGEDKPARTADRRASLRELAEYLKLSPTTVSRVMSRSPDARSIPVATQDRIFDAARELNYQPNMMAQSLRKQRSFTIGVMVPEISEGYSAIVLSGIEEALLLEGFFFFVVSHRHREALLHDYQRLLVARAVEGIVAVDTPLDRALSVPVVTISGHKSVPGSTNIVLNHRRAAQLALTHLFRLGHREIAIVKGQTFSSDTVNRWEAIQYTARDLGLKLNPALVVQLENDSFTSEPGYAAAQALVRSGQSFSAIFAFNDVSAIGAIRAIREAGLRVPEDISIVGFDDIPSAAFQHPALTTVRQPLQDMGALAIHHLLRRIRNKSATSEEEIIVVEPELVVRSSTCPRRAIS